MSLKFDETVHFKINPEKDSYIKEVLDNVYASLKEKGYNPVNQLVGYIISGDPAYITSFNDARNQIKKIDRNELVEEILIKYMEK